MPHITCENIVKIFGGTRPIRALDGLTLTVEQGEVFGLLGPNGSGKTTFVRCCLNIIYPTSGSLRVLGRRPGHPQTTRLIGYLPENPNFYDHLTGKQFLYYHAELAGIPLRERTKRIDEILELVKLAPEASGRRLRTYSKGMLQRIGLGQALIGKPKLLFLDEPQTGLDPIGRRLVKNIMHDCAGEGTTVLFSSHVLADVEDVADRVAIIDKGQLRKIAKLNELTSKVNRVKVRLFPDRDVDGAGSGDIESRLDSVREKINPDQFMFSDGILTCSLDDEEDIPKLVDCLVSSGLKIYRVEKGHQSLEDVFLEEFGEMGPGDVLCDKAELKDESCGPDK